MEQLPDNNDVAINDSIYIADGYLISGNKKIALHTITAIKFGWLPIRLEMFRVGDRYVLEVKNQEQKIRINLRSYFGIQKDTQYERFNYLLNIIWDMTVTRLCHDMIRRLALGESVHIGKCQVTNEGITHKEYLITWKDLSYQKYYNRLTLNSKSNSSVWTNLYYTDTDNVHVLIEFLDWRFGATARQ